MAGSHRQGVAQGGRPLNQSRASEGARAVFVDASPALAAVASRVAALHRFDLAINEQPDIAPDDLPDAIGDAGIALIDHTRLPTEVARRCRRLRDVVFLGTGARSYMDPDDLARHGIAVHLVRGYGDTAVAEMSFALMWAAAKHLAAMDGAMRRGRWLRMEGTQLTGRTVGLIGLGGIGREMARLCAGAGMRVLAWNRTPVRADDVEMVDIDTLLAAADVVSLHLLLGDETRGFLSADRIARVRPGAILINTARGALVDEAAMIESLRTGRIGHAGLDVFDVEPLPGDHPLLALDNVTLSAHSAFRTPEASENLIRAGIEHCRRILAGEGMSGPQPA